MKFDTVIVGAGFAGLLAAQDAVRQGRSTLLIEKAGHAGGQVGRGQLANMIFDSGAEAFSTAGDEFLDWLELNGLGNAVVYPRAKPPTIFSALGKNSIPVGVFGVPADLADPALAFLGDDAISLAEELDGQPLQPNLDELTVAELIDLRLGPAFTQYLVGPIMAGVHSCSAAELEARTVLSELLAETKITGSIVKAAKSLRGNRPAAGSAVASLQGGMHRLIDSMVSNYLATGGTARFGSAVGKVSHSADGWLVELDGEAVIGTELVIATPPHSAAKILGGFSDLVAALTEVETVDTTLTTVLVEAEALNEFPLGTGALVDESLGLQVKATTHINAKWPWLDDSLSKNQHLIRFSFSESINGQGLDYEAAAIEALDYLYELKAAEILGQQVTLWKGSLVRAGSGHSTRVKNIQNLAAQHGLGLAGAYLAGNGLAGLLRHNKKGKHIGTYA